MPLELMDEDFLFGRPQSISTIDAPGKQSLPLPPPLDLSASKRPNVVIIKPSRQGLKGISDKDIQKHYNKAKHKLLKKLKGKQIILKLKLPSGMQIKRNDINKPVQIKSIKDIEKLLSLILWWKRKTVDFK